MMNNFDIYFMLKLFNLFVLILFQWFQLSQSLNLKEVIVFLIPDHKYNDVPGPGQYKYCSN